MPRETFQPEDFEVPKPLSSDSTPRARGGDTTVPPSTDELGHSAADTDFAALSDVTLLKGRIIKDRYVLDSHIAEGGFGAVFKGTDQQFPGKPIAIKLALDPATHKYFVREARMLGQLKSDFVVSVYDYGVDRGIPFIVMEYLDGMTLEDLLHDHQGQLPDDMVAKCVDQVGRALESAHALNLIHRDLKPRNIMLVDCGDKDDSGDPVSRFKILDFGIASKINAGDSVKNATLNGGGTPEYMSPEQIRGADAAPTSDVYTYGVLIFQLLTGEVPFSNKSYPQFFDLLNAIVQTEAPRISTRVSKDRTITPLLEQLVAACLEKDPQRRPTSIREVRHRYRRSLNLGNSVTGLPGDYEPPPVRPAWKTGAIAVLLPVILGFAWLMFRPNSIEIHAVPHEIQLEAGGETEIHLVAHGAASDEHVAADFDPVVTFAPPGIQVLVADDQHDSDHGAGDRVVVVRSDLSAFTGDQVDGVIQLTASLQGNERLVEVPLRILPPKALWSPGPLTTSGGWQKTNAGEVFPSEFTVPQTDLKFVLINPARLNRNAPRNPFYMSIDCISRDLYTEFAMSDGRSTSDSESTQNPTEFQTDISYLDCIDFVTWLNEKHPLGERGRFRMPTWDEWWAAAGYFSEIPPTGLVTDSNPFRLKNIAAAGYEWTSTLNIGGRTFEIGQDPGTEALRTPGADRLSGGLTYKGYDGVKTGTITIISSSRAKDAKSFMSFRIVFEPRTH